MPNLEQLSAQEWRCASALASIFFLRMLGLFMLLPVLALYADRLEGATQILIGAALGIYGLTQAIFQVPFGRWSDRVGRKPAITIGLLVFAAGGLIAAVSGHIIAIVMGRAVQGAGAISGATLALAADLTRPNQRTKVMAIIGITIGFSFSIAFILGPLIDAWIGLSGLFFCAAALGLLSIPILWVFVPSADSQATIVEQTNPALPSRPAAALVALYLGVFSLHAILAANFISIPLLLTRELALDSASHYTVYLPVLLASLFCVGPMIMASHRSRYANLFFRIAIFLILCSDVLLLGLPTDRIYAGFALILFFTGFNFLEASLPSLVSQVASSANRGTALGIYSSAQFIGMFVGGLGGGAISGSWGYGAVFTAAALAGGTWLIATFILPIAGNISHPKKST